jgi:ERI1 exoribonuclease 3
MGGSSGPAGGTVNEQPDVNAPELVAVLDFEATCAEKDHRGFDLSLQEIIELPVGLVSVAEHRVVDVFATFVRPVLQPDLTPFCTALTSITTADVAGAPSIDVALESLARWLDAHGATADRTLVATCGDWDLRSMWPRQVSLRDGLPTPELFRRWCNLKVVFAAHTGRKPTGMLGMLRALRIPHEGHHHRGVDDVKNLCRVVVRLLEEGAAFRPTWDDAERRAEHRRCCKQVDEAHAAVEQKRDTLAHLPADAPPELRHRLEAHLAAARARHARAQRHADVFADRT